MNILLVDDSKDILDLVGFIVEKEGHNVMVASCGKEALEAYAKIKPDFIFLDIKMPDMTGIEVLQKIRQVDKNTAVVILTAFGDEGLMKEAESLGVAGFIHKGREVGFVSESVRAILKRYKKD